MSNSNNRRWKALSSQEIFRAGFFRLRKDSCELPDGRHMPSYYVMEFNDWCNIVPITSDRQIVLVEQYRHAGQEIHLEIPGGSLDQKDGKPEDPCAAAVRELLEETGYASGDVRLVVKHSPNPALQNNFMHTYIAYDCKYQQPPQLDPFEDIRVVLLPVEEVIERALSGQFTHSIVAASLLYALPHLQKLK